MLMLWVRVTGHDGRAVTLRLPARGARELIRLGVAEPADEPVSPEPEPATRPERPDLAGRVSKR